MKTYYHLCNGVKCFLSKQSAATLCVHEPRVEHVNAASPLAKAAELCYVNVGDGKQQLCSAQPFLSTMRGFLLTLLTLSMEKEILFYLNFYSETNKNIHMYFRAANTAFVCLIKREYAGWRGSAQLLSAYIG